MTLIRCLLAYLCLSLPAAAADFKVLNSGPCFARLDGQIVKGDVARFEKLEKANPRGFDGELYARNHLCFNSPGGSLTEGIKLANYLRDNRIGTRIEGGDSCLSACSLAFMAGVLGGNEEITGIDRQMDVNATLGFHRPAISLNTDKSFDAKAMEQSFNLALEATLNFVVMANSRLALTPEVMVKSDLIEAMFAHRGQDFFYIDTVDKAGRWDIEVTGWDMPRSIDKTEAWNVCENAGRWPVLRNDERYEAYDPDDLYERVKVAGRREQYGASGTIYAVTGSNDGLVEHFCHVMLETYDPTEYQGLGPSVMACGTNEIDGVSVGGTGCREGETAEMYPVGNLSIFPPTLPLKALPTAARQIDQRPVLTPAQLVARKVTGFRNSCSPFTRPTYVANVQNFVNLRSGVGFGFPVVTEIPRDEQVQGLDGPHILEQSPAAANCMQSCERSLRGQATDSDRRIQNQCFEDNLLWFGIETPDGQSGYVSGKYLRF